MRALLILLCMHRGSIFYLTSCNSCTTDLMAEGMVFKIDDIICLKKSHIQLRVTIRIYNTEKDTILPAANTC